LTRRERHDGERRDQDRRDGDRRDGQPDDDQQRRPGGEVAVQEGDSLTALKGILSKVASLLKPLQLTPDESIRLVEQLYESVLEMDVKLAGESDDTRKSSVLAHIQHTIVRRDADKLIVEYPAEKGGEPSGGESAPTQTATSG
jgi:hypothetical protein